MPADNLTESVVVDAPAIPREAEARSAWRQASRHEKNEITSSR